ncbi:MAG: DASS family sodium-coupled anion symporter [Planctomycetota bacterium]|nr:DASS family sodium-coupled anion symporter [Planctomycetota bacterium]
MFSRSSHHSVNTAIGMSEAGRFVICVVFATILWLINPPSGLSVTGWRIFAIFSSTILGFILRPLAMAPLVLIALSVLVFADALSDTPYIELKTAFAGFGNTTTWLVVSAILISGTIIRTNLGNRIALLCFLFFGRNSTGLGYAACATELMLAPFIPSNTARGGGILAPVIRSINASLAEGEGDSRIAANRNTTTRYLIATAAHANLVTSAMFLTAMAANPIVGQLAGEIYNVAFTWSQWCLGGLAPGLFALCLLPLFIGLFFRDRECNIQNARDRAREGLAQLGPMRRNEILLVIIFLIMILLWATSPWHSLPTTLVCISGVAAILLLRVDQWTEMAKQGEAWDTLVWLGGLLTLATALKEHGVVQYFADFAKTQVTGMHPLIAGILLALIYFYSMYGFSMLTGHIIALAGAFLLVAQQAGTPSLLMVPLIAYLSSLCGCLTNYSTGPVIIYFNQGQISSADWFRVGFFVSIFHLLIWVGLGPVYWKFLGWW